MGEGRCLYPGSFDPVTNGHMDIILRASRLYDRVYVGVLHNPEKKGNFTPQERVNLLKKACADIDNVEILLHGGLMVDLARRLDIRVVVRGIRGVADMESEMAMARANRMLYPNMETLLLPATPQMQTVSASLVRQIASFGGDVSAFVPAAILDDVRGAFAKR